MVLVQMAEAGDTSVGNIQADSRSTETSLDLAEELFVTCRFTEAASVCNDALLSSSNSRSNSSIGGRSSASLGPVVVFGDQVIAPVGECDTSDLVVAVLLQCGFELRRTEEWARCRAFYGTGRAIPFAVAVLWLRLHLAGGEIDLARRVLWQLRDALSEELRPAGMTGAADSSIGRTRPIARSNYLEVMEMLILQVMLPHGESVAASTLLVNDVFLGRKEKGQLLRSCELFACRMADRDADRRPPGGQSSQPSDRTAGETSQGVGILAPASHDVPVETTPQEEDGPVHKFFSGVSDWTPESRLQLVVGAGAAGLAAYAACRNRHSLWRAVRSAAGFARATVGGIGAFIVGSA